MRHEASGHSPSHPRSGSETGRVHCEKSQAARLSKGQSVAVLCTGRGIVIGTPSLGDCTLAK